MRAHIRVSRRRRLPLAPRSSGYNRRISFNTRRSHVELTKQIVGEPLKALAARRLDRRIEQRVAECRVEISAGRRYERSIGEKRERRRRGAKLSPQKTLGDLLAAAAAVFGRFSSICRVKFVTTLEILHCRLLLLVAAIRRLLSLHALPTFLAIMRNAARML